jgi:endo-1,4-beta-mannosidase
LEKYQSCQPNEKILPVSQLDKYNVLLKEIAKIGGIEKRISSHEACRQVFTRGGKDGGKYLICL